MLPYKRMLFAAVFKTCVIGMLFLFTVAYANAQNEISVSDAGAFRGFNLIQNHDFSSGQVSLINGAYKFTDLATGMWGMTGYNANNGWLVEHMPSEKMLHITKSDEGLVTNRIGSLEQYPNADVSVCGRLILGADAKIDKTKDSGVSGTGPLIFSIGTGDGVSHLRYVYPEGDPRIGSNAVGIKLGEWQHVEMDLSFLNSYKNPNITRFTIRDRVQQLDMFITNVKLTCFNAGVDFKTNVSGSQITIPYRSPLNFSWNTFGVSNCYGFVGYDFSGDGNVNAADFISYVIQNPDNSTERQAFLKRVVNSIFNSKPVRSGWIGAKSSSGLESLVIENSSFYGISCRTLEGLPVFDYVNISVDQPTQTIPLQKGWNSISLLSDKSVPLLVSEIKNNGGDCRYVYYWDNTARKWNMVTDTMKLGVNYFIWCGKASTYMTN